MKKIIISILLVIVMNVHPNIANGHNELLATRTRPQNVIMMVGDGMGLGHIEIAKLFEYGRNGKLFIETLPYTGLVHTHSANNSVTDSAAGGTALATGKKTNNGMIGVTADGKEVDSILDKFKENGKKVGVISTNTVTDATPAAFTASVENRWKSQPEIARQQLKMGVDVLLGGGKNQFLEDKHNGTNLIEKFIENGYTYVTNKTELNNATGDKLLGLFHPTYMSYKLDREVLASKEPTLQDMTKKAVDTLSIGEKGFFLMVEGARIDHAAHSSDITGIWKETIEFDQTVKYVVDWAKKRKDTLVIVVADHETMGISATEPLNIENLKNIKVSPSYMASKLVKKKYSKGFTEKSLKQVFKYYANIELSSEDVKAFNRVVEHSHEKVYNKFKVSWEIGHLISRYNYAGVVPNDVRSISQTGGHTGNMIPIFAFGIGADLFNGVLDNTDVPKNIAELMGYELD